MRGRHYDAFESSVMEKEDKGPRKMEGGSTQDQSFQETIAGKV